MRKLAEERPELVSPSIREYCSFLRCYLPAAVYELKIGVTK